jgi:glutathione-specific gamma-glutamylcyclotransferase
LNLTKANCDFSTINSRKSPILVPHASVESKTFVFASKNGFCYGTAMSDCSRPVIQALPPLSVEERAQSLAQIRAAAPQGDPIRIFAYGSLIWDPCFAFEAAETAVLGGFRRAFNFWSVLSRGTPERPGLGLGLERGGSCRGVLFRLAGSNLEADLDALWKREMYSAVYAPRWLRVDTPAGPRSAIAFVTNTGHGQYAGGLDTETVARIVAGASGENGPCRDYLAATVDALARHGIDDPALSALRAIVDNHKRD